MKAKTLNPIPTDSVSTWIDKESEGNDGETWRVWLLNHAKTHAYIKIPDNPISIIAELAAAQVGRGLNLNIPAPYIITLDPEDVPEESRFFDSQPTLAYGSNSCGTATKSFERIMRFDNTIIDNWSGLESTLIFDEWIANADRNLGNLIYDTDSKTYWLIDHGRAFTDLTSIFADENLNNHAIEVNNDMLSCVPVSDVSYMKKLQNLSNQLMLKCHTIDMRTLDSDNHYPAVSAKVTRKQLSEFLINRINITTELICRKTGNNMFSLTY